MITELGIARQAKTEGGSVNSNITEVPESAQFDSRALTAVTSWFLCPEQVPEADP